MSDKFSERIQLFHPPVNEIILLHPYFSMRFVIKSRNMCILAKQRKEDDIGQKLHGYRKIWVILRKNRDVGFLLRQQLNISPIF